MRFWAELTAARGLRDAGRWTLLCHVNSPPTETEAPGLAISASRPPRTRVGRRRATAGLQPTKASSEQQFLRFFPAVRLKRSKPGATHCRTRSSSKLGARGGRRNGSKPIPSPAARFRYTLFSTDDISVESRRTCSKGGQALGRSSRP